MRHPQKGHSGKTLFLLPVLLALALWGWQAASGDEPAFRPAGSVSGREPLPLPPIYLMSGTQQPSRDNDLRRLGASRIAEAGPYYYVQLAGPVQPAWKAGLEAAGARVYDYIPDFAYLVRMSPAAAGAVSNLDYVTWMGAFAPEHRVHPRASSLRDESTLGSGHLQIRRRDLLVSAFPDADMKVLVEKLSMAPMQVTEGGHDDYEIRLRVSVPLQAVEACIRKISSIPEVNWVDVFPDYKLMNSNSRWIIQSNSSSSGTTIWNKGIHGEGQIVASGDSGIDYDMCYFRDASVAVPFNTTNQSHRKIVGYECLADCKDNNNSGHGTHVNGSIAGEDIFSTGGSYNGMAYKAKLYFQDIGNTSDSLTGIPSSLTTSYFPNAYNAGARIHSNSWGSPSNTYSAHARDVDNYMWTRKDFLVLFAAGNSGPADGLGEPGTCKNCIVVGATDSPTTSGSQENLADFSSHGPTPDGRIKPDVCAPGNEVRSADSDGSTTSNNCGTLLMPGTSMATPTTAGGAALVRQYYTEGWYPSGTKTAGDAIAVPSAALVKATVVNSAVNMTGNYTATNGSGGAKAPIPTSGQGWGRVFLENALFFAGDARKLKIWDSGTSSTGGTWTQTVTVNTNSQSLKVTLAWTDYPSSTTASVNLVNDLDLEVVSPSSTTYLGNVFSGGVSTTGGSADRRNNLEQVLISAPAAGSWTVRVKGYNVPQGPQPFAVVVTGDVASGGTPPPATYSVSGAVTSGGAGVSGVTVAVSGQGSVTTDASGNFTVTGLVNGSYTLTPSKTNWTFSPVNRSVSVSGANVTGQDFTATYSSSKTVLFVDDDGGKSYEGNFTAAIQAAGRTYDSWNVATQGSPDVLTMKAYPVVVWNTGAEYGTTLTATDETNLQSFLDAGGKLFLSSQDYLYERGSSSTFDNNYLKVSAYTNDTAPTSVTGVSGDPITNGMSITFSFPSGFTNYADDLTTLAAGATNIFTNSKGQPGAVKVASGAYRAVFLAFPFEAIPTGANPNNRETLMKNALDWLQNVAPPPSTYSVSGTVIDGASNPLSGVTVSYTGAATGSVTTASNGSYAISGLANGSYTLTPSKSGYTFSPASRSVSVSGANVTGQNFTGTATAVTYSISGAVSGAIADGVTINLSGAKTASTSTAGGGNYSFTGLASGSYTVTPSKSGYTFSPVNRSVSVTSANVTGQNFTSTAASKTVLFVDDDGGKSYESYFTASLTASGRTYDVWTVSTQGSPTLATLNAYPIVVWSTGDQYTTTLTATDETNLQSYLDGGKKLFFSSQDYLYERGASSTFDNNYLKLSSYTSDTAPTTETGVAGDPISNGLSYTLSFPSGFTNYADSLTPGAGATNIFTNSKGASGAVRAQAGSWKLVFLSFPFESVPTAASRDTLMTKILDWLQAAGPTELLSNGGFESGATVWTQSVGYSGSACFGFITTSGTRNTISGSPRSGSYVGWLGGVDGADDHLYQQVSIPAGATKAELRFWTKFDTTETTTTTNYDYFYAQVRDTANAVLTTLLTMTNLTTPENSWVERVYDVTAYKGTTIRVYFRATNDDNSGSPVSGDCADVSYKPTHFWVDDASLTWQ
jgi:subtilisin family serine protease